MRTVKIIVVEDNTTGEMGMLLKGTRLMSFPMAMYGGYEVAHDVVDHQNGAAAIGSIADEIEALGALWFNRGQYGDIRRANYFPRCPYEVVGADIAELARIYHEGVSLRTPIKFTHSTYFDDDFEAIIESARSMVISELDSYDEEVDHQKLSHFEKMAKHLLRSGYRKAKNRFGDAMSANTQFWNIAEAVDRAGPEFLYEGQEFVLKYDESGARFYEVENSDW